LPVIILADASRRPKDNVAVLRMQAEFSVSFRCWRS